MILPSTLLELVNSVQGLETANLSDSPLALCDSLSVVELLVALDEFGVVLDVEELLSLPTFGELQWVREDGQQSP